jgi:hypothetical protein
MACVNVYRLYQLQQVQLGGKPSSHLEFRVQLTNRLLEYLTPAKLQYLRIDLGGKRLFSPEFANIHYWIKRTKQDSCKWCLYKLQRQRVLDKGAISRLGQRDQ